MSIRAEEYSKDELSTVSNALALHLLRAADGKTRGLSQRGVLLQLAKDLLKAEKSIAGMPDSDDENSDDDDDDNDNDDKVIEKDGGKDGKMIPRQSSEVARHVATNAGDSGISSSSCCCCCCCCCFVILKKCE